MIRGKSYGSVKSASLRLLSVLEKLVKKEYGIGNASAIE